MKTLAILPILLLFTACANRQDTPTGRPEVVINGTPVQIKRAVIELFVAEMGSQDRPYSVASESDHMLVLERDAGAAAGVFLGGLANQTVHTVVRLTLVPTGDTTRVLGAVALRNGYKDLGANTGAYDDLQFALQRVAARVEGRPEPVKPPPPPPMKPPKATR